MVPLFIRLFFLFSASTPFIAVLDAFTLITFDVDGTLVHGYGSAEDSAHSHAFGVACGSVLGTGQPTEHVTRVLARHEYHGSTDGLILLRLARAALRVEPSESFGMLDKMMSHMYEYIADLDDEAVAKGIAPLPGVLDQLQRLASMKEVVDGLDVACGLVTGNVEGIARRKMRAVGILQTGALSPPSYDQVQRSWPGADDIGFLGGFGSDFCSGNIDDADRNYLDRAEQIAIAARRCCDSIACDVGSGKKLSRVVHVGDAPADVLAAKAFAERSVNCDDGGFCVGMVAVATGSFSAEELKNVAGEAIPGEWEPVVLEDGMADPRFLKACGVM